MIDLAILCEGKTERTFAETLLAPHFEGFGVRTDAVEIGIPNIQHGGGVTFGRVLRDVKLLLSDHEFVTTLVDFFKLGKGWRGINDCTCEMTTAQKAESVECAALEDAKTKLEISDIGQRFIPNVLMHEFEGLLFTDPEVIVEITRAVNAKPDLLEVAAQFVSPEDINSGDAPSKRLVACGANYGKAAHGARIAKAIGLPAIRGKCPHFDAWMGRIEGLEYGWLPDLSIQGDVRN